MKTTPEQFTDVPQENTDSRSAQLSVVIASIAILATILCPVFARAAEASGLVSTEPGLRVLAFEGLYFWVYGCGPEKLRSLGASEVTDSYLVRVNLKNLLEKIPSADALPSHNVVLMADVDASPLLKARFDMEKLRQFVQQGGGLVILGGQFSFGENYAATALEDLCPVEPSKPFNLVKADPPLPLKPAGEHDIIKGLDFGEQSVVVWHHRVKPRPDAQVILRAGDEPLLVVREVGKGRVVAFLGSVLGEPANPMTPFWKSKLWPELLRRTLNWAGGKKEK